MLCASIYNNVGVDIVDAEKKVILETWSRNVDDMLMTRVCKCCVLFYEHKA